MRCLALFYIATLVLQCAGDDIVLDLGSFSSKAAKLKSLSNQIEDVKFRDGYELPTIVALGPNGERLVGKEAFKKNSFTKICFFTNMLFKRLSNHALDTIKSFNHLVQDKIKNDKSMYYFIFNKLNLRFEEFKSFILSYIKDSLSLGDSDNIYIILDTLNNVSRNSFASVCKLADIHNCYFIDERLSLSEAASSYLEPIKKQILVIDYSFSFLKILLIEGFVANNGSKYSLIVDFKEYSTGSSIQISQISNFILSKIKTILPKKKINNELMAVVHETSIEVYRSFSHSQTKKIPFKTFGMEMNLEKAQILSFAELKTSFADFEHHVASSKLPHQKKVDIILVGSPSFEQNFQQILRDAFPSSNIILPNDPARAKVQASARLLKNRYLKKQHKIQLGNKSSDIEIISGNQTNTISHIISYNKEYLHSFSIQSNISNLQFISGKQNNDVIFNCSISSNANVEGNFTALFIIQPNFEPILTELSVPLAFSKSVQKLKFSCVTSKTYYLTNEEFESASHRTIKAKEVEKEAKNFKNALNSLSKKIHDYHTLINDLQANFKSLLDSTFENKITNFIQIIDSFTKILESLTQSAKSTYIQKITTELVEKMKPLDSNLTYYKNFPNYLNELNATIKNAKEVLNKTSTHKENNDLLNLTTLLEEKINESNFKISFYHQEFLNSKFLEAPSVKLSDVQVLNFDVYQATWNLQRKYKDLEAERILLEVQNKYGTPTNNTAKNNDTNISNSFNNNQTNSVFDL